MENQILDTEIEDQKEVEAAGFWVRFGAYILDMIPILIVANILVFFLFDLNPLADQRSVIEVSDWAIPEARYARGIVRTVALMIWILYSIIMDAGIHQGTLGKQAVKIKVIDEYGDRLSYGQSAKRNLFKILSYIPLGFGFIRVAINPDKRSWHDQIAKTYVVKKSIFNQLRNLKYTVD